MAASLSAARCQHISAVAAKRPYTVVARETTAGGIGVHGWKSLVPEARSNTGDRHGDECGNAGVAQRLGGRRARDLRVMGENDVSNAVGSTEFPTRVHRGGGSWGVDNGRTSFSSGASVFASFARARVAGGDPDSPRFDPWALSALSPAVSVFILDTRHAQATGKSYQ